MSKDVAEADAALKGDQVPAEVMEPVQEEPAEEAPVEEVLPEKEEEEPV